ncbi:MAG: tetratricopeptide repeat protein [Gammaproteobacteria bacterium]
MRVFWVAFVLLQIFGGGVNEKNKEGAALYEEGKLDEALVAFTQAQEQSPDAPEIHYNIGNVHFRKQEMQKALEEYRTSLNGSPEVQARSHYNSGNVFYRGQSYSEAIDAYKQAADEGRVERKIDQSGYPPRLEVLVAGVEDRKDPKKRRIYFLRRIPPDPFAADADAAPAQTWGVRSYASPPDEPREGEDVFDVYTLAPGKGINGRPYREW